MSKPEAKPETKPAEFIKFHGALYRVATNPIRSPGFFPTSPEPSRVKLRPHPFSQSQDPSRVQARQALKQEIVADLEALIRHLAEAPVGPSELRGKFDQFSSGIAMMTDKVKLPLEDGLKGLASTFRKLLKAREAMERLKF
jgi:hypothetical protein